VETIGLCEEGVTLIYEAAGEAALNGMGFAYTARKIVELEPAACTYVDGVCSVCGNCAINRIYGNDRIGTALSVAAALKDTLKVEKFDAIILAAGGSGQDQTKFADALSGSYLASAKNAPILLYTKGDLAQANLEFIAENLSEDGTIYLLGGNVSIPAEVEAALVEAGYTVKRLAGDDRYLTNLAILKEVGVEGVDEVLIAGGQGFADSLSASATGLPIMLVKGSKTTLTEAQIEFLKSVEGKKITILGGNAAVSAELEAAIEEVVGKDVDRVFGETREETSVMIAKKYFPEAEIALITYSKMYPDGLAGGVLANVLGAPLLLTKAGSESIANEYIEEIGIEAGYVLGGSAVMTDETAKAVFGLPEHAVIKVYSFK
jgi:putative cell wall-binding protein